MSASSPPIHLDVNRAKAASSFTDRILEKHRADAPDVRVEIEGLAARIMQNGLLQTLVYLLEKDKADRNLVGIDLLYHLVEQLGDDIQLEQKDRNILKSCQDRLQNLNEKDQEAFPKKRQSVIQIALKICDERLQNATEEALRYAYWLKLMAKAEIEKKEKEDEKKGGEDAVQSE